MQESFELFFAVFSSFRSVWSIDNIIGAMFISVLILQFLFCLFVKLIGGFLK